MNRSRHHRPCRRRIVTLILSLVTAPAILGSASAVASVATTVTTDRVHFGNRDNWLAARKRRVASALFESPCDAYFVGFGEGGIRTHEAGHPAYRFSKPAPSAAQTPLHTALPGWQFHIGHGRHVFAFLPAMLTRSARRAGAEVYHRPDRSFKALGLDDSCKVSLSSSCAKSSIRGSGRRKGTLSTGAGPAAAWSSADRSYRQPR